MIGSAAHIDFMAFVKNLAPVVVIIMIALSGMYYLLYAKNMHVSNERKAKIMEFDESKSIENIPLLIKV